MRAGVFAGGEVTQIYVLIDPRNNDIRYVGKTNNITKRLVKHVCESKISTKSHKKAWINQLLKLGLKPIIEVVDVISTDEWEFWEQHYISLYKSWGFKLTNLTKGGGGVISNIPPWNKGTKGVMKANETTFKSGNVIGKQTRFKRGEHYSIDTQFKKGQIPHNIVTVLQYDAIGNFIQEFDSYATAAKTMNVTAPAIRNAMIRKNKCKGFIWKRKN